PYFNYTRADHIRALFRFKHGQRIGERGIFWLKVSTANRYGGSISRLPFEARAAWSDKHLPHLRQIAEGPLRAHLSRFKQTGLIEGKSWLEAAKDHFQLIAHARELVAAIDAGPDYITTLPLSFDASNSGAQHYAMLARDPDGARLTNLTFAGSP